MPQATVKAQPPGWFGKVPSLGDFASRRLSPAFVDGWDAWLQRELPRSRDALGERWLDAFLVAPVRRFWIAPRLLGGSAWVGVWMPSVDAVGRHYPFTVAMPCAAVGPWPLAREAAVWFDAVDAAARRVLDPQDGVEALEHALATLPPMAPVKGNPGAGRGSAWWCAGADQPSALSTGPGLPAGDAFDRLLSPC